VIFGTLAVVAGVAMLVFRREIGRRSSFRNVPVLGLFDRAAKMQMAIIGVGIGWICIGIWGLVA